MAAVLLYRAREGDASNIICTKTGAGGKRPFNNNNNSNKRILCLFFIRSSVRLGLPYSDDHRVHAVVI